MAGKSLDAVEVKMLFRAPVAKVFEAFVDPTVTTKFWFNRSDGPLVQGESTKWYWDTYGVSTTVDVVEVELNSRIKIEWGDRDDRSTVEWTFEPHREEGNEWTSVKVCNSGIQGTEQEAAAKAIDSMGGFTLVMANAKALLDHDIDLNLMIDR